MIGDGSFLVQPFGVKVHQSLKGRETCRTTLRASSELVEDWRKRNTLDSVNIVFDRLLLAEADATWENQKQHHCLSIGIGIARQNPTLGLLSCGIEGFGIFALAVSRSHTH